MTWFDFFALLIGVLSFWMIALVVWDVFLFPIFRKNKYWIRAHTWNSGEEHGHTSHSKYFKDRQSAVAYRESIVSDWGNGKRIERRGDDVYIFGESGFKINIGFFEL